MYSDTRNKFICIFNKTITVINDVNTATQKIRKASHYND